VIWDVGGAFIRYRGHIVDKFGKRLKANAQVTRHNLLAALDEVLAEKLVTVPVTQCIGVASV